MVLGLSWAVTTFAQEEDADDGDTAPLADSVSVQAVSGDDEIARRLQEIFSATGWFQAVEVSVQSGVVFLDGDAVTEERRRRAEDLASNTEDVVAVVNRISVPEQSPWDLGPTLDQLVDLTAAAFRRLPLVIVGALLLVVAWLAAKAAMTAASGLLGRRVSSRLLRDVVSRAVAVLVFVAGVYVVLRVSGLTGLAVTIVGGTGLLGLAIGFAFRDIAENFLASILISIQRPFAMGDLIEVDGHTGYVQRVNTRATLIMTRDGNHVQVPNAVIYKNTIKNFTANPRSRESFIVGIGYDDSIAEAQTTAFEVLRQHPAVMDDPEPLVLVDQLSASTVNLRVSFWVDIEKHDHRKVRSAIIRQTKSAFDETGISMPDEAREVIFPAGVPVSMEEGAKPRKPSGPTPTTQKDKERVHRAEGDLSNDDEDIEKQARDARSPEGGANLI